MDSQLDIELYKSLKEEFRQYLSSVQSYTTMKFIAIAAIASTLIANQKLFDILKGDKQLTAIGLLFVPIVCFFLDLKILEATLHIRSISNFIAEKYSSDSNIADWENLIWSKQPLPRARSILTIISSVGISLLIFWASLIITSYFLVVEWKTYCIIAALVITIIIAGISLSFIKKLWKIK